MGETSKRLIKGCDGYGSANSDAKDNSHSLEDYLQEIGLGWAQLLVWLPLVLLALTDLSELLVTTLIMPFLRCEWDLNTEFETAIGSASFFSYAVGGLLFGRVSDMFGRKKVLLVSSAVLMVGGGMASIAPTKWVFLAARIVQGLAIGASYPTSCVFVAETTHSGYKELPIAVLCVATRLGVLGLAVLAWLTLNTIKWRWFMFTVSAFTIISFISLFLIPDSPRYLLARGKFEEAESALRWYFRMNRKTYPEGWKLAVGDFQPDSEKKEFNRLFSGEYLKSTIILSVFYFTNIYVIFGINVYSALAEDRGLCGTVQVSGERSCSFIDDQGLLNLVIIYFADLISVFCSYITAVYIGRKVGLRVPTAIMCLPFIVFFFCLDSMYTVSASVLIKFMSGFSNVTFWIILIEVYPTVMRNTATGFINFWGKLGGSLATLLTYYLFLSSPSWVIGVFLANSVVSFTASMLWIVETKDTKVVEFFEEGESARSLDE